MIVRLLIAALFSAIGVAGLILPILPGWLFLVAGVLVLFPESRMATAAFDRLESRMPRVGRLVRAAISRK